MNKKIENNHDQQNSNLRALVARVSSGNALLFLGSGFSADAVALDDKNLPIASKLAELIGTLGKFESEGDLRYAADKFLGDHDPNQLVDLLRATFTIKSTKPHHISIARPKWRRIYTTNYDLCFERAAEQANKVIETVDLESAPAVYSARNNVCIHLNGSLNNLTADSLNNQFKLSTSSYLDAQSFVNSRWNFPFQRDLDFCSAIVFVGYSLYDIEIQRILHANAHYKDKTFFISRQSESERNIFTLSKFGTVIPISGEGFGNELEKNIDLFENSSNSDILASLSKYELNEQSAEVRDSDVDAFLMRGDISDELFDAAITTVKGAPSVINRADLVEIQAVLMAGADVVITADFGNGKSVFLRSLRSNLTIAGFNVYTSEYADSHQHDDLEKLVSSGIKGFLLIDAYDQNLALINHYAELKPENLRLILAARTSNHERHRTQLLNTGLKLHEVSIDELDDDEVNQFVGIIDNVGLWGDRAALSPRAKIEVVSTRNQRQISLNLLDLLSAPQIVSRVKELLAPTLSKPEQRDTVFAIALLSLLDMPLTSSLISDIAMNFGIYDGALRDDAGFSQLFRFQGSVVISKSSVFASTLISHQFPPSYIVDQILKIVEKIGDVRGEVSEKREIRKSLLRFSVIERLFPEKQRKQNLVRYYEYVKRDVPWLKNDPHFWLQYGMAQLTFKEYEKAQGYFDQAYAIAAQRNNYHTVQIDTQQARLHLMRSLDDAGATETLKLFTDANRLLKQVPIDTHRFRQVELYKNVFERNYRSFPPSGKVTFEHACRDQLQAVESLIKDQSFSFRVSRIPARVKDSLTNILDKIRAERTTK